MKQLPVSATMGFPRAVFYISAGVLLCDGFAAWAINAVLVIYFVDWLNFDPADATSVYHVFLVVCFESTIIAAVIADSYWGKYKTILVMFVVFTIGACVLAFTAMGPPYWVGPILGLLLVALGISGVKACLGAFGLDQFPPGQEDKRGAYSSLWYFTIHIGKLIAIISTPNIRARINCFGGSCFPLAFGLPVMAALTALVIFACGTKYYTKNPPADVNVIGRLLRCVWRALRNRFLAKESRHHHWLDYADDKFDDQFINESKAVLHLLVMFLPLPVFSALVFQQGSRWTLQARSMNLHVVGGWYLPPDQMQVLYSLCILIFIPMTDFIVYPLCARGNLLIKPLQRMVCGMSLAALAFLAAGTLQIQIDQSMDIFPASNDSVRVINTLPCAIDMESSVFNTSLAASQRSASYQVSPGNLSVTFTVTDGGCEPLQRGTSVTSEVLFYPQKEHGLAIGNVNGHLAINTFQYPTQHLRDNAAYVGLLYIPQTGHSDRPREVTLTNEASDNKTYTVSPLEHAGFYELTADRYSVYVSTTRNTSVSVKPDVWVLEDTIVTFILREADGIYSMDVVAPRMSFLWQIPQYVLIVMAAIFFYISILVFAYSESPSSMTSVMQAVWLTTVAFGNILDAVVTGGKWIPTQTGEFFFFAILMILVTVIFAVMSHRYTYVSLALSDGNADDVRLIEAEQLGSGHDQGQGKETLLTAGSKSDYGSTKQ